MTAEAILGGAAGRAAGPSRTDNLSRERVQRLQAVVQRGVMVQGAIAGCGASLALAWILLPGLPGWTQAVGVLVTLAAMLAGLFWGARRMGMEIAALYRQSIQRLEQELNDLTFRESVSSVQDKTTGVYTYEFFVGRLREEVDRAQRYGRVMSLLLVDLAGFRRVNEQFGREAGNQVLRRFAVNILRSSVRSTDIVARLGGDQFVALLTETDSVRAQAAVRRVVDRSRQGMQMPDGTRLRLPVNIGVAGFPGDAVTAERLVQAAEQSLHASKASPQHRPESGAVVRSGESPRSR